MDNEKFFYDLDGYRSVSFACSPPLSSPPIDRTNANYVIWLKDGQPITRTVTKQYTTDNNLIKDSISFDAVTADIGQYSCVYAHFAGERRHAMTLKTYGKL